MGAVRVKVDPCLYEWCPPLHGRELILVYVDDLIVADEKLAGVERVKRFVSAKCEVRDMAEVTDSIGMKVMRNRATKTLTLNNSGHTLTLLKALKMGKATPEKTPMATGVKLTKIGGRLLSEGNRYAELVGSLLYLSTTTRPDISFAVGVLSRFMSCPKEDHMRAAKGCLRYLRGTTRLVVVYCGSEPLQEFVDAEWVGDIYGRRSTIGFVFTCNSRPIARASKRQSTLATSTVEAEYVAAAMVSKEALWLRKLLLAPGVDGGAVRMGEDNQFCLALVTDA